jgi:hypothetical protein
LQEVTGVRGETTSTSQQQGVKYRELGLRVLAREALGCQGLQVHKWSQYRLAHRVVHKSTRRTLHSLLLWLIVHMVLQVLHAQVQSFIVLGPPGSVGQLSRVSSSGEAEEAI